MWCMKINTNSRFSSTNTKKTKSSQRIFYKYTDKYCVVRSYYRLTYRAESSGIFIMANSPQ